MAIYNLINNNGRAVANQFVITNDNEISFQSYDSLVCQIRNKGGMGFDKVVVFGRDWDYSRTTMKHLCKFLDDNNISLHNSAEIRKAIDKGYIPNYEDIAVMYDATMY